jgi:hypothetical protein
VVTVVGVIVFLLVANALAMVLVDGRAGNLGYWVIREKWQLLEERVARVTWLILGDSSCNQGVVPGLVAARTGADVLNLCTTGNLAAAGDAWMLDAYIRRHGAPEGVIVVHAYDTWPREVPAQVLAQIPLPWGFWRRFAPDPEVGPKETVKIFLARFVPLYSRPGTLRALVRTPWRVPDVALDSAGFMRVDEANPERVSDDAGQHLADVRDGVPPPSEQNEVALDRLGDLAERYDFPVFIVPAPIYDSLLRDPDMVEVLGEVRQDVASTVAEHENVRYVDVRAGFRSSEMENADHVTYPAALRYTAQVLSAIERLDRQVLRTGDLTPP